eukprot:SAG31_NODE_10879_length_1088_cov_1.074823_1_plen_98_part_01
MNIDRLRELGITHVLNCAAKESECAAAAAGRGPFSGDPAIRWAGFQAHDVDGYLLLDQHLAFAKVRMAILSSDINSIQILVLNDRILYEKAFMTRKEI